MSHVSQVENELRISQRARIQQATIRSLFLTAFVNALSDDPQHMDALLKAHGFDRSQTMRPYDRLPLHRFVQLLEDASCSLGRTFLGLEMGKHFGLPDLGPFHALFSMAGNLRQALDSFATFQGRWQSDTFLETTKGEDTTIFSYRIGSAEIWPRRQDAEFTVSGLLTLVRQFYSTKWCPVEVHFEHPLSCDVGQYQQLFKCQVIGNKNSNCIVVLNSDLDRPLPQPMQSNSAVRAILEHHLLDLLRPEENVAKTVSELTSEIIDRKLGQTAVDCDMVAAELNMSPRSFRRRLSEEGSSFRQLLQKTKDARARTLLSGSMPLASAAESLGYADAATFSRAFKDWTGTSPGRFSRTKRS